MFLQEVYLVDCEVRITPRFTHELGGLDGHCGSVGRSCRSFLRSLRSGPLRKMSLNGKLEGVEVDVTSGNGKGDNNTEIVSFVTVVGRRSNFVRLLAVCSGSRVRSVSSGRLLSLVGQGNLF